MTRQQELDMIDRYRTTLNDDSKTAMIANLYETLISDGIKFELEGLRWDAMGGLPSPDKNHKIKRGHGSLDQSILLLAAGMRCLVNRCPHALLIPGQVIHVLMPARLSSCKACLPTYASLIQKAIPGRQLTTNATYASI